MLNEKEFPFLAEKGHIVSLVGGGGKTTLLYAMAALPGIRVRGLMTVPPILTAPEEQRRVFSQMYKLFIDIRGKNIDNIRMDMLSMGMSSDYEQAILEGSTLVRIGSALFGRRL